MKCIHWFMVTMLVLTALSCAVGAEQDQTKVVVVSYLFKDGKVTYVGSRVVYGYPPNNAGADDFNVNLLGGQGATLGSYKIGDPRILYYEGGADMVDEVAFSVTLPFSTDAREVRIYERDGTTLVSTADISGTISSFCSQHPNDPDCGGTPAPTGIPLCLGTILTSLGVAVSLLLKKT
jgi:hypothetical protein